MKIISKYKDYYDYLTGRYGIDEKIVLDRRGERPIKYLYLIEGKISIHVADMVIDGLLKDDTIYYGEALLPLVTHESKKYNWLGRDDNRDYEHSVGIKSIGNLRIEWFYTEPWPDPDKTNTKENCPILLKNYSRIYRFPKLDDLKLPSVVPPESIYGWLIGWLSNRITEREKVPENVPNDLKIESKGFDKKRSFRPKMK